MSECNSFEEYKSKFYACQKVSGFGAETTMHLPCPFCAEPDFLVHRIIDTQSAYRAGAVCPHCNRGARALFRGSLRGGGIECEFVQFTGPEQPAWLPPMRVVSGPQSS